MVSLLIQGLALGLTAAASPGPFQAFLVTQTLAGGFRRGAPAAFAPLISDGPLIVVVLLVLDQLPPFWIRAVSIAGALFIFYLAWGLWLGWRKEENLRKLRTAGSTHEGSATPHYQPLVSEQIRFRSILGRAVVMNLLSPGPYTFWMLVTGPLLLSGLRQSPLHGSAFLFGFYSTLVGGMLGIAFIFHQLRRLGPRIVHYIQFVSIMILIVFGLRLVWQGLVG